MMSRNIEEKIKREYFQYVLNTYTRVGPVFVKGKGSWLYDINNNKYLDLFPGWGVSILGHAHPRIVRVISQQARQLIHLPNNLYHPYQGELAKIVVKKSFKGKVFFANSGAEGVEGAIKFSRLFGQKKRYEIIVMKNSFHGRTFGALSATGQSKYKEPFEPILEGFKEIEFNNIEELEKAISSLTVAILMELIQGEGGVNIASAEFVKKVKECCQKYNLLFIVDEVQTGMGRTGKLFAYQNYGVEPDIMILSKGLGGGFPISLFVVKEDISQFIKPGQHASTFGGNPLACRVSKEVFDIIDEEKILSNVRKQSNYLKERLDDFQKKFSFIKDIRIKGLMAGIELDLEAHKVFLKCLENRLIINATHINVLRIMPALNVSEEELMCGMDILEKVFKTL